MNGYYSEIIEEIRELIRQDHPADALFLIKKELAMPYIPQECEEILQLLKKDAVYRMAEKRTEKEETAGVLLRKLKGRPQEQLAAAEALSSKNLREVTAQIREYLAKDPFPEAAALVIDALAEQEVAEEFVMVRDGLEYTFWGDAVTPVHKSEGFLEALKLLEFLLEKEPALLEMARSVLVHTAYMYLPLSYDKEEARMIALQAVRRVGEAMGDPEAADKAERKLAERA